MAPNHLNNIEKVLIDNLRDGTYNTTAGIGSGSAWTDADVTVFGQFPTTDETKYPCIITELVANGIETQFMGQNLTDITGSAAKGELYGMGYNIYLMVDRDSSITVGTPYRERRLLNYLMLNCANVLTDCDFTNISPETEVEERHFSGFREIGYNPQLETWVALASVVIVFKNTR
jgi:hypothetical protein